MLADPGNDTQTTLDFACPEIVTYLNDMTDDNLGEINFTAQDMWSVGCMLVWLATGQDPFACFNCELDMHKLTHLECMTRKQAAWVSFSSLLLQMRQLLFAKTHTIFTPTLLIRIARLRLTASWLVVCAALLSLDCTPCALQSILILHELFG